MIKSTTQHMGVCASVYEMDSRSRIEWHKHPNEHTLSVIRGSVTFEIKYETGQPIQDTLEIGQSVLLPAEIEHRFWALQDDTIAIALMACAIGSDEYGENGGVLLNEKADT